jgi:hypothetical protein
MARGWVGFFEEDRATADARTRGQGAAGSNE